MKVYTLIIVLILVCQNSFAQGPEETNDGFSLDAVLTGFSQAVEGYEVRGSLKVNNYDQENTNFSETYTGLIIKMKSSFSTKIVQFDSSELKPFNQTLVIGEIDLLNVLNLSIKAQIPYANSKQFILDNRFISPSFFNYRFEFPEFSGLYGETFLDPNYLAKRDQLADNDKPMSPQFVSGSLRFSKALDNGKYKDHHLRVVVKSPINVEEYELYNCQMMGLLLPVDMHLFYKLDCDYKLTTSNYSELIGDKIKQGAQIKGFIDLSGDLDPAFYESNFSF